jgi:hypothetical protein
VSRFAVGDVKELINTTINKYKGNLELYINSVVERYSPPIAHQFVMLCIDIL